MDLKDGIIFVPDIIRLDENILSRKIILDDLEKLMVGLNSSAAKIFGPIL